jgi:transposase-like protein
MNKEVFMQPLYVKNRTKWKDEEKERAIELATQGISHREISGIIGRSYNSVRSFLHNQKVSNRRKNINNYDREYQEFIQNHYTRKKKDPRSLNCQKIQICNGKGCYRAEKCPAHAAFLSKHQSSGELKIAI